MIKVKKWKIYLSIVTMSAVLPAVLWAVISGQNTRLTSRASPENEMRIWFEPAESRIVPGETVKIKIIGSYNDPQKIVPYAKLKVSLPEQLTADIETIYYRDSFSGTTTLGEITVGSQRPGKYILSIKDTDINTSLPDLNAITFPAIVNIVD